METKQLPSFRAQMVTRRTYNRPTNVEGTEFETWPETVNRVVMHQEWLWTRSLGRLLNDTEKAELEELRELILERKAMLAGRTLWLGGTDVSRERESSMFNPFVAGTQLMTKEFGLARIETLASKTFHVIGSDGNYHPAVGSYSGKQPTSEIEFYRGRQTVQVTASDNHRWWLENGERVTTSDLEPGDIIPSVKPTTIAGSDEGFLHGMVYGDGSVNNKEIGGTYLLRLCGAKDRHFWRLEKFSKSFSFPPSANGDRFVYFGHVSNFANDLKSLPTTTDPTYIAGFIEGLLAADGSSDGFKFSGTKDTVDYVEQYAHLVGRVTGSRQVYDTPTNFGPRTQALHSLTFTQGDAPFRVRSVNPSGTADVWCCTVPSEESFVLKHGILTSNCAFSHVETVYDVVDCIWLLLQGCGVGFRPIVGTLTGFSTRIKEIETIRSVRTSKSGEDDNVETWNPETRVWTIKVGDSAVAWARFFGKIMAGKYPAKKLVLDFSAIRPAGERLRGYGWLSSGDTAINKAALAICGILNRRSGALLSRIDILDVVNWLGTILSSRRSAEIAIMAYGESEWKEFAQAKKDYWIANIQRAQSNNSLLFYTKPTRSQLTDIFDTMIAAGGSEPGFINAEQATKRAPWFSGVNPCAEILLANKSFCNLSTIVVSRFKDDNAAMHRAAYVIARANYRQTCVDLRDGVLQEAWHLNNDFLHLCGVSMTGLAQRPDLTPFDYKELRRSATYGAYSMAQALGSPVPKNVTTIKPEGTISKICDSTEGMHKPLARYILNNINYSKHDPLVEVARAAGYRVRVNPVDGENVLITFPVEYPGVEFDRVSGVEVNLESAVEQLDRYKTLMDHWCDQNVSATISYSPDEKASIVDWLLQNWDSYVGVSFLFRNDPTKTAQDLGYLYLPNEVVSKKVYDDYVRELRPVDLNSTNSHETVDVEDCVGGVCPVR